MRQVLAAAGALGRRVEVIKAKTEDDIDVVFATLAELRAERAPAPPDLFFNSQTRSERLAALTVRHAVPRIPVSLRHFS